MGLRISMFLSFLVIATPGSLMAAAGVVDSGFGTNGVVAIDVISQQDFAADFAIQNDGKFVIAGSTGAGGARDFLLIRGLPNATPDPEFGFGGSAVTPIGPGEDIARDVAVLPDGKILVLGSTDLNGGSDVAFARYHANGILDTGFGTGGIAVVPVPSLFMISTKMVVQPDGRIVVTGASGLSGIEAIFVARYLASGALDTSFDGDGVAQIKPNGNAGVGNAVALQEDGKIVVAGNSGAGGAQDFTVIRLNPDGSLDSGFDGDGIVLNEFGTDSSFAQGLAIQADGRIAVAGTRSTSTVSQVALARYLPDGVLDASFGTGGIVTTPVGAAGGSSASMVLQDDGRILVVGSAAKGVLDSDSLLIRYLPDGAIDLGFGSGGFAVADAGDSDIALTAALQPDGKILLQGQNNADLTLIRFQGNSADVRVNKSSGSTELSVGDDVDFTLTVSNDGPDVAGVRISDLLPPELELDPASVTVSQGGCDPSGGLQCLLGALESGDAATVTYRAKAVSEGSVVNQAAVTGQSADPDSADNADSVTVILNSSGGCQLIRNH